MLDVDELLFINKISGYRTLKGLDPEVYFKLNKSDSKIKKDLIEKGVLTKNGNVNMRTFVYIELLAKYNNCKSSIIINNKLYQYNDEGYYIGITINKENNIIFDIFDSNKFFEIIMNKYSFLSKEVYNNAEVAEIENLITNNQKDKKIKKYFEITEQINEENKGKFCCFSYKDKGIYTFDYEQNRIISLNYNEMKDKIKNILIKNNC